MTTELIEEQITNLIHYSNDFADFQEYLTQIFPLIPENTQRAYIKDMNDYLDFCNEFGYVQASLKIAITSKTIKSYVDQLIISDLSYKSIRRKLSSISSMFNLSRVPNPITEDKLTKVYINKKLQPKQLKGSKQAPALTLEIIDQINDTLIPDKLLDLRDLAMINVMFDTMLRASELIHTYVEHIDYTNQTLKVMKTKSNKSGVPEYRFLSKTSLNLLNEWFSETGIKEGIIFRGLSPRGTSLAKRGDFDGINYTTLYRSFKRVEAKTNIDLAITTHSCRVGAAVSIYENGGDELGAQLAGGWRSSTMPSQYMKQHKAKKGIMATIAKNNNR